MPVFSLYLREIVYGGTDGIITTFAVVCGFFGAESNVSMTLPVFTVLLFGFANLFADGVSMALGSFLATRSEQDVYKNEKAKEFLEIHNHPETQKNASMEILLNKGFTKEQAKTLVDVYATNPSYWVEFVMSHERSLQNPEREKPYVISLMTFLSFIGFGVVPLIPYVLHREHPNVFFLSVIATAGSLFLLGIVRYFVTKQSLLRSIVESLFLGGIAAFIAYMVGRMANIVGL